MEPAAQTRVPPRLIHALPPADGFSLWNLYVLAAGLTIAALVVLVVIEFDSPMTVIAVILLIAAIATAVTPPIVNFRYRKNRAAYMAQLGERQPDPLAQAVEQVWTDAAGAPAAKAVCATLDAAKEELEAPPRACIVCLGAIEVPTIEDNFFEPEIITPTRAIGARLWFAPAALAILTYWFLQIIDVIPVNIFNVGGFAYIAIMIMGLATGIMWVWRTAIRPTYIRMAPGMIQILEYGHSRSEPNIRSYPLDAGTLVIARGPNTVPKPAHLTLTLMRGTQQDKLELWRMRKAKDAVARTWQALLSTAPAPPVSDEDLLG